MRAPEIAEALVRQLRAEHPDATQNKIRHEMSVGLGSSRIDIGLLNGLISGYEIKSPRDNFDRLPSQVVHYSRCLDRAIVVTSAPRSDVVTNHVPEWWGISCAERVGDEVTVRAVRTAQRNPSIDPFYVAQLLWRDEAYAELEARVLHQGLKRATRWELWDRLAELPLDTLRDLVRERLKARPSA